MARTTRKKPVRHAYHHGDLRNALIRATLELIDEVGPKGVRLTEAARRAGVSAAAPYRHFADLEAMLAAVAFEGNALLGAAVAEGLARPGGFLERAEAVAAAYVRFARRHRAHFRAMFDAERDPARHPELREAIRGVMGPIETALRGEVGRTLPATLDVPRALVEIWAQVHGVAALLSDDTFIAILGGRDPEELARGLVRRYVEGLRTRP